VPFVPKFFTEKEINDIAKSRAEGLKNISAPKDVIKQIEELFKKALKEKQYSPPVFNMINDGKYIFVFIRNPYPDYENMHVIDCESKKVILKMKNPFYSILNNILNGFFYYREKNKDGYWVIRVYKLHPGIYGKEPLPVKRNF